MFKDVLEYKILNYLIFGIIATAGFFNDPKDRAKMNYKKAVEDRSRWILFLNSFSWFDNLRDDKRFQVLLKKIGLGK